MGRLLDYAAETRRMLNEEVSAFAQAPADATHFSWAYGVLTFTKEKDYWENPPVLSCLEEKVRRHVSHVWESSAWKPGSSGLRLHPIAELPNKVREEVEYRFLEIMRD